MEQDKQDDASETTIHVGATEADAQKPSRWRPPLENLTGYEQAF